MERRNQGNPDRRGKIKSINHRWNDLQKTELTIKWVEPIHEFNKAAEDKINR